MTKEQKILMLLVLLVAGGGTVLYLSTQNTATSARAQATTTNTSRVKKGDDDTTATVPVENVPTRSSSGAIIPPMGIPKNITAPYMSSLSYETPDKGSEKIHVTLFVKDGVIQDVRFIYDPASSKNSGQYLGSFSKALAGMDLKGKKVSEVSLSRVGGASLTTGAFMKAVAEINVKANS